MNLDKTQLANWITRHISDYLGVIIAGKIIGGRYGDAPQKIIGFEAIDNSLIILFDPTTRLWIRNPIGINISENNIEIKGGDIIRWGWHYKGRPKTNLNWCESIYILDNNKVKKTNMCPLDSDRTMYVEYEINENEEIINIFKG